MKPWGAVVLLAALATVIGIRGCKPLEPNELDKLGTVTINIEGRDCRLWLADDMGERNRGLMHVTAEQMAPLEDGTQRGMLFVFDYEQHLSFWMKDTIIPLDVAYLTTSGVVLSIHTMAPLDDRIGQYRSGAPARFAIEVNAGLWSELGLEPGDHIQIPSSVLKRAP
jgi:uncharacterized membrane protein (UPF0127 family)